MSNKTVTLIFAQIVAIGILGILCVLLGISRNDALTRAESMQAELDASAEREEGMRNDLNTKSAYIEELENRAPVIETVEVEKIVEVERVVEVPPENEYSAITMTEGERDLLWWILALEAKDQPDVGQRAVVEVIFNRVLSPDWPDTVEEVLYQPGQFSTIPYLTHPYVQATQKELDNIDFVITHGRTALPEDFVYFATYKANGKDFLQIEDHYFAK